VSQGKSALMIEGARRVRKSFIVEELAKAEYASWLQSQSSQTGIIFRP